MQTLLILTFFPLGSGLEFSGCMYRYTVMYIYTVKLELLVFPKLFIFPNKLYIQIIFINSSAHLLITSVLGFGLFVCLFAFRIWLFYVHHRNIICSVFRILQIMRIYQFEFLVLNGICVHILHIHLFLVGWWACFTILILKWTLWNT